MQIVDQRSKVVVGPVDDRLHLLVRKPPLALDDRFGNAILLQCPLLAKRHEHAVRKTGLAGHETAKVVGEALREHGDDAIDKVRGVAALACLAVELGAVADVGGDVGDVHAEFDEATVEVTQDSASSKSRASTGSIVTIISLRRSRRPCGTRCVGGLHAAASASTSAGKDAGRRNSLRMAANSTVA